MIDARKYHDIACSMMLMDSDIEIFFEYPKEFFDYIDVRTFVLDSHIENEKEFYGINLKMKEEKINDIKFLCQML